MEAFTGPEAAGLPSEPLVATESTCLGQMDHISGEDADPCQSPIEWYGWLRGQPGEGRRVSACSEHAHQSVLWQPVGEPSER